MAKIKVKIVETLQRVVEVEAESFDEAEDKVRDMYRNCDIVLTSDDYVGTDFKKCDD